MARKPTPILEGLREILIIVDCIAMNLEQGVWRFDDNPSGVFLWDETQWTKEGAVFGKGFYGHVYDDLTLFEIQYSPLFRNGTTDWELSLTRDEVAHIASGELTELALYACAHPLCGFHSSDAFERCPRCKLQAGTDIATADSQVRGICPRCRQVLRALYAQQCPHCFHEFREPR